MFYGAHLAMSPPSKSRLKRQGRLLSSMLSRTLSHRYRDPDAAFSGLGAGDDPAELSTQLSAPGILKVFGDSVCSGTHYKSVLATARSSAQELVREALERYGVDPARAGQYVLCDAVGQAGEAGQPWQAACFRVFADNEKPLLIQEFWKPREGLSRRFELRKKSDVEELAAKDVDTVTAGENQRASGEAGATPRAPVLVQPVLRGPGPGPAARPALDGQRRGAALLRPAAEPALHAAPGGGAERLRLGGVAALLHACGQRGGHGAAGGDRSLRLPAVRLLHLQGILTRSGVEALPSPCPVEPARVGPGDASEDGRAPHAAAGQNHSCPWHPEQERGAGGPLRCGHFLWALWALGQRNSAGLAGQQPRPGQGVPQTEVIGPGRTRGRAAPGDERAAPSPQALYVCLPGLLEGPPFQTEPWEGQGGEPVLPEELRRVVAVYQAALDLLRRAQLHPEVASQVLAYLLFFSGTLLFNQLLDKGPLLSCFHWPRGVQACARLQQLLEWVKSAGFGSAGEQFFQKLSCTLNLLATPSAQLVQMPWAALRTRFPALSPAQLHRLLTRYQLASAMGPVSAWEPGTQESSDALKPEAVLESYENPPPIVLPSGGFQVDPEADCVDDSLYQHVLHLRHFLQGLQSQGPAHAAPDGRHCTLASGDLLDPRSRGTQEAGPAHSPPPGVAPWAQGPPGRPPIRGSAQAGPVPTDASCLLTPPSTPLELEPGGPCGQMLPEGQRNGLGSPWGMAPKGDPSSRSSSPEESCCVFLVELERGPSGLGLGLIDGLHTPQGAPGLYVQTLLPGSPAACDGRLSLGDRILEVNGASLVGLGYRRAVDLIRQGGKKMRFLVAKSDMETTKKIHLRTPHS
ncbi:ras-associating and dilute domain-containing protein isoform X7 [Choloepus didactylus]|uniref:ras-associating and dilute domain-containing protein isoform X7 n=1 Tax=Choloepus didactylus TaxID=27675 RepID=UPI00189DB6F1|nr:ras-associating and dilute domain-containing protein isoform X7 [Choloepus didactylus]